MKISIDGVSCHYEIQGSGPWLTLAHSLACDLSMWDDQAKALCRDFTVLRYDARGHGDSGVPPGPYAFDRMAADVVGLWDALGVEKSHFCGLSMGGMTGQTLALTAPQRVDRLVLCSTSSGYGKSAALAALWEQRIARVEAQGMAAMVEPTLERWFTEPYRLQCKDVMARIGAQIVATPPAGYAACGRMIPTLDITPRLGEIRAPTLVLAGEQDAGTPPAMAEVIARGIPGARLEILPQAAHLLNIEQAQLCNALIAQFLG